MHEIKREEFQRELNNMAGSQFELRSVNSTGEPTYMSMAFRCSFIPDPVTKGFLRCVNDSGQVWLSNIKTVKRIYSNVAQLSYLIECASSDMQTTEEFLLLEI